MVRQSTTQTEGILLLRQQQARVAMAATRRLGHERFVEDPLAAIMAFAANAHARGVSPASREAA